ncbi:hypothetical protein PLICRDRAFT_180219, partial [Plicaturopsis crispa FD-325 SS-3]
MSTSDSTTCPVLQEPENFQIWRLRITAKLRVEKVYGVVSGAELAPSSAAPPPAAAARPPAAAAPLPAAAASASTPGTPHGDTDSSISAKLSAATDSWEIRDAKAHGIIMQYISDNLALQVDGVATSKGL